MIQQTITLTTGLFEVTTPEPEFINPRCFGQDFATWLADRLSEAGFDRPDPIAEDFGWALVVPFAGHHFTLAIGVMDDSIGAVPAEWSVTVAFEKPLNGIRSWFRKPPSDQLLELARLVESVLTANPAIHDVRRE